MTQEKFTNLTLEAVNCAIERSSENSAVYIGCDSKVNGSHTLFGLVVVIHIDRHKGGMVYGKKSVYNRRMVMFERIMREVDLAMQCAFSILDAVGERSFEVHLDINPNPIHKSNRAMKQAMAYVKAQGFNCQIKPDAWAASTAADYLIS